MNGRDELLQQPVRKRLMSLIKRQPGIHASEICRETGEAWGTVQYHLSLLRTSEMVTSLEAGRERRFFPHGMDNEQTRLNMVVSQGRRSEIARYIMDNPGIRQVDICKAVGVSRKTLRASVSALMSEGLVTERKGLQTNRYFPDATLEGVLVDMPDEHFDVA